MLKRLALAASAAAAGLVLVPAGAATAAPQVPPLPCSYWVHSCDVVAYVCDLSTAICYINPVVEATKP